MNFFIPENKKLDHRLEMIQASLIKARFISYTSTEQVRRVELGEHENTYLHRWMGFAFPVSSVHPGNT